MCEMEIPGERYKTYYSILIDIDEYTVPLKQWYQDKMTLTDYFTFVLQKGKRYLEIKAVHVNRYGDTTNGIAIEINLVELDIKRDEFAIFCSLRKINGLTVNLFRYPNIMDPEKVRCAFGNNELMYLFAKALLDFKTEELLTFLLKGDRNKVKRSVDDLIIMLPLFVN